MGSVFPSEEVNDVLEVRRHMTSDLLTGAQPSSSSCLHRLLNMKRGLELKKLSGPRYQHTSGTSLSSCSQPKTTLLRRYGEAT